MIRVVFDTNTVISAQFWHGAPRKALNAIRGGKADYIISGDDDLLRLDVYAGIPIWTVNRFLEVLDHAKD